MPGARLVAGLGIEGDVVTIDEDAYCKPMPDVKPPNVWKAL